MDKDKQNLEKLLEIMNAFIKMNKVSRDELHVTVNMFYLSHVIHFMKNEIREEMYEPYLECHLTALKESFDMILEGFKKGEI